MRQMPAGHWVAFEGYETVHDCSSEPQNQNHTHTRNGPNVSATRSNWTAGYDSLDFLDIQISDQQRAEVKPNDSLSNAAQRPRTQAPIFGRKSRRKQARERGMISHASVQTSASAAPPSSQPPSRLSASKHAIDFSRTFSNRSLLLFLLIALVLVAAVAVYLRNQNTGSSRQSIQSNNNAQMKRNEPQHSQSLDVAPSLDEQAKARYNEGVVLTRSGNYLDAVKTFKEAVSLRPDYAEAFHELGYALYRTGKYQESIEASKRAAILQPQDADNQNNLGLAYSGLKRWKDAVEAFRQAAKIKDDNPQTYYGLGIALKRTGDEDSAIDAFRRAIQLRPKFANAHYELGISYLAVGDQNSAMNEYEVLRSLNQKLANQLYSAISRDQTDSPAGTTNPPSDFLSGPSHEDKLFLSLKA